MKKAGSGLTLFLIELAFVLVLIAFLALLHWRTDYKKFKRTTKPSAATEKSVKAENKGEGAEKYPEIFNGLKQFPLGYQPDDDEVVAVVIGHNYDNQKRLRLELITIEGNLQTITINRHSEVWFHEISPSIGKYTEWSPVIAYFKKERQIYNSYNSFEIKLEGRFVPVWGDKKDGEENKVIKYINEKYPY